MPRGKAVAALHRQPVPVRPRPLYVSDSILGRDVIVEPGATVRSAIIMQGCVIKTGARVENAIVDRNNVVSAGTELRGTPEDVLVKEKPSE